MIVDQTLLQLSTSQQRMLLSDKTLEKEPKKYDPPPPPEIDSEAKLKLYETALALDEDEILKNSVLLEEIEGIPESDTLKTENAILQKLLDKLLELDIDLDDAKLAELVEELKYSSDLVEEPPFVSESSSISGRVAALTRIFNVLSFKHDIDYPVCSECAETLMKELQAQHAEAVQEKNTYVQFLNRLSKQSSPNVSKLNALLAALAEMENKYNTALAEIRDLEKTEEELKRELETVDMEIESVNEKETELMTKKNVYELELIELASQNRETLNSLHEKEAILEKLKSLNVYSDVFNISSDGPFGTINDLRLGSLKNAKVLWMEINSALGQIVLLLSIIIKKMGLSIKNYKLIPMGSYLKIEKTDYVDGEPTKTVLECFSLGTSSLGRLFAHNLLDQAMVALLNVIKQMENELRDKYDKSIRLPHLINVINNTIQGLNIKLMRKITDDEWTMACKYLVTDVKYLLAFVSSEPKGR